MGSIGDVYFASHLEELPASEVKKVGDAAGTGFGASMAAGIRKQLSGSELKKGLMQGLGLGAGFAAANIVAEGVGLVKDAFIGAIEGAVEFEQGMRNVNSIAKLGQPEFEKLSDDVLAMGAQFGQSAKTMVDAMYDINSSGFQGAEALQVLEASALAATAGVASTGEAAAGIVGVMNAYGFSAAEAGKVSDVLFKTVERGVVSFPQLAQEIGGTTALAAPLGVSLEEVGAALAVMTRAGVNAAESTTQLNGIMASMLKPSKEATDLANKLGLEWNAAGLKANGLTGQMNALIEATGGSEEEMAVLLGDARAIRGAFILAKNGGADLNAELEIMKDSAGAANDAFSEQKKGTAYQLAVASAKLEAAGIEIGQKFLPILADLAEFVNTEVVPAIKGLADVIGLLQGELPEAGLDIAAFIKSGLGPIGFVIDQILGPLHELKAELEKPVDTEGMNGLGVVFGRVPPAAEAAEDALTDAGDAAEEMGSAAERGADDFRTAVRSTLEAVAALRAGITGDAATVAAALYDPQIAALEAIELQEELRANRKAQRDKDVTAEEKLQLQIREQEILKSMIEQNAILLTYGTEAEQISKIKAFLTSDWWRQAYEGATPEQADALDAWKLTLQGRLDAMEGSARDGGEDLREGYIGELKKGAPGVRTAIITWSTAANEAFIKAQAAARAAGKDTAEAYAEGLRASYGLVNDAAYYLGGAIWPLKVQSPPPAVPWIIESGRELGELWAKGVASAAGAAKAAAQTLAGGFAAGLAPAPAYSLAGAVNVPGRYVGAVTEGRDVYGVPSASGGNTYEYHIHAEGQLKVRDPLAAANLLARFQGEGLLPEEPT